MMDETDLYLLTELEKGLPLVHHPYAVIGEHLGIEEEEVIRRIRSMKKRGVIRRFRARINQRSLGIVANALVGWEICGTDADTAGLALALMPGVSHCYRRGAVPHLWKYTHYTVHHGWSEEQVLLEVEMIAQKTGFSTYIVLFSTDEYKRSPHVTMQDLVAGQ